VQPELGRRVRELRRRAGLSQAELAGDELSMSYVSLVESGRREPSPKVLTLLSSRLGVDEQLLRTGIPAAAQREQILELRYVELALAEGDAAVALDRLATMEEEHPLAGDPTLRWQADALRARALEAVGQLPAAIVVLEGLRDRAVADPASWSQYEVAISLSRCYREAGDLTRAVEVGEQVLASTQHLDAGRLDLLPELISTLAMAYRERGDLTRAGILLNQALTKARTRRQRGAALWNASIIVSDQGRPGEALELAERALALFAEDDDDRSMARLRVLRAWLLLEADDGHASEARALLRATLPALRRSGSTVDIAYAETELARAELALGRPEEALVHAQRSLNELGETAALEAARARLCVARALAELKRDAECDAALTAAATALQRLGAGRQAANAWRELAEVQLKRGQSAAAVEALRRALDQVGIRSLPVGPPGASTAPLRAASNPSHQARAQ